MPQNAREVIKILIQNDFIETRISGDHHRFEDGLGHKVTVPYSSLKDELKPKTFKSILRQAGLI